jgi:hypothetical protein
MTTIDAIKMSLWACVNGTIEITRALGLMEAAELIAAKLEGATLHEKLAQFELGLDNREVIPGKGPGNQYVLLKHCPFRDLYDHIPEWPEGTKRLVASYNRSLTGRGGVALHPLCIVHQHMRGSTPEPVVNIACRSEATGKIVLTESNLETVGLTRPEVKQMIADHACLYCIEAN